MLKIIKQISCIALSVALLVLLVSCSNENSVNVNADKTASFYSKTTYSDEELNTIAQAIKNGDDSFSEKLGIDADNVDSTFSDLRENLRKEEVDGKVYYYEESSENFKNISDLEKYLTLEQGEGVDNLNATFQSVDISPTELWLFSGADMDISVNPDFAFSSVLKIRLPYNVVKTNGTKVDSNTVEFDMLKDQGIRYVVTEKSTASWAKSSNIENSIKSIISKANTPSKTVGLNVGYRTQTSLKVSWNYNSVNYDCDTLGYQLQRRVNSGAWTTVKTTKDSMTNSYVEKNIKANKTYSYRVRTYSVVSGIKSYGPYSKVALMSTVNFKTKPTLTVSIGKKKATIKVKKKIKNVTGYQIQYSVNSKYKNSKKVFSKKTSVKIQKLKSKKTYFFRARSYKKSNGKTYYGSWSKTFKKNIK